MRCEEFLETAVLGLSRGRLAEDVQPRPDMADRARFEAHLENCSDCRAETERFAQCWDRLGDDLEIVPSEEFRGRALSRIQLETTRRRFGLGRSRRFARPLAQLAAIAAAAVLGFAVARWDTGGMGATAPGDRRAAVANYPALVGTPGPGDAAQPRFANVAYVPADASGKLGVTFDLTTRHLVSGRPGDRELSELLARLLSQPASLSGRVGVTEGARGQAVDLLLEHLGETSAPSAEIVAALARTLREDKNPGVRRKAAEALARLEPSAAIRDAFIAALANDSNPAVRITAVEALAAMAARSKDATTLGILRDKAGDERENGYVRVKAASALQQL